MSVLRQFKLFSAPQASPWPYLFSSFHVMFATRHASARRHLQVSLVAYRAERAGNDDGLEFFGRARRRVRGEVIVIVGEHGGAVHVLASGANTHSASVANDFAQAIFGVARAEAPHLRGVA
jgi:hypothetical protein